MAQEFGPLESPAIGTARSDLIRACDQAAPDRGVPPVSDPKLAVALSGGGFRASCAALGVLRLLADASLLGSVRYASSVSGGSVANGYLACRYPALEEQQFTRSAFDSL